MRRTWAAAVLLSVMWTPVMVAEDKDKDKPTSPSDAQAAVEANLGSPEGKKYDELMGTEFMQKHIGPLRQCKQTAGNDLRSFWILSKLDQVGTAEGDFAFSRDQAGYMRAGSGVQGKLFISTSAPHIGSASI